VTAVTISYDFLWQNVVWLVIGGLAVRAATLLRTRLRHRRLRMFFGKDALAPEGISVTVPILSPLTSDAFDKSAERTNALKATGKPGQPMKVWPIYGRVLHLDDYNSSGEIFALLRDQGAKQVALLPDSDSLGKWEAKKCFVCLGSPFVNATFAELVEVTSDSGPPLATATRTSDTLDSYRVCVGGPEPMTLGVDETRGIGVIARVENPAASGNWVIGVWGCRAESTLTAARYLREQFGSIAKVTRKNQPLIVLLTIRGSGLDVATRMFAAADRVLDRRDDLLHTHLELGKAQPQPAWRIAPGGAAASSTTRTRAPGATPTGTGSATCAGSSRGSTTSRGSASTDSG
jgi:hypothetical protein